MKMMSLKTRKANAYIYKIRVSGVIDPGWSSWLNADSVQEECQKDGTHVTAIYCTVKDQAALHGLLKQIWNLNLTVISLFCLQANTHVKKEKQDEQERHSNTY